MSHVERRHAIVLAMPIERAFPLFTPDGERAWVDDWRPEYLHPLDGATCAEMVFRTRHGGEETLWSCIEWSPAEHRVRYARVTPGSRFGHVEVACREIRGGTEVSVRYALTALSAEGLAVLAALTEEAFRESIDGWRTAIEARIPTLAA